MTPDRPRLAVWILEAGVSPDAPLCGDLDEEFAEIVSRRGLVAARRWYWRQIAKTVPAVAVSQLRSAPWAIAGTACAGTLLLWALNMLLVPAAGHIDPRYPPQMPDLLRLAMMACEPVPGICAYVLPPALVGWVAARMSRNRELAVCLALAIGIAALRTASVFLCGPASAPPPLWSPLWLADPTAAVVSPLILLAGGLAARKMTA